jgi:hypothetical protein
MQTEPESLFELLEPPPGGIERMRARVAEASLARRGVGLVASSVVAIAAIVALLAALSIEVRHRDVPDNALLASPELDRLLGREGTRPVPLTVERDGQPLRTEELPSSDPRVRIYRVL